MQRADGTNSEATHKHSFSLFDQDGLPWCSKLSWNWLLIGIAIFGFVLAPLIGVYLGLWLRSKGRSPLTLALYIAITGLCLVLVGVDFPAKGFYGITSDLLGALMVPLWFIGAFLLRYEVAAYYQNREAVHFKLNPVLTALFGPWYIGGNLRADFPLDATGKIGSGLLKLIN